MGCRGCGSLGTYGGRGSPGPMGCRGCGSLGTYGGRGSPGPMGCRGCGSLGTYGGRGSPGPMGCRGCGSLGTYGGRRSPGPMACRGRGSLANRWSARAAGRRESMGVPGPRVLGDRRVVGTGGSWGSPALGLPGDWRTVADLGGRDSFRFRPLGCQAAGGSSAGPRTVGRRRVVGSLVGSGDRHVARPPAFQSSSRAGSRWCANDSWLRFVTDAHEAHGAGTKPCTAPAGIFGATGEILVAAAARHGAPDPPGGIDAGLRRSGRYASYARISSPSQGKLRLGARRVVDCHARCSAWPAGGARDNGWEARRDGRSERAVQRRRHRMVRQVGNIRALS